MYCINTFKKIFKPLHVANILTHTIRIIVFSGLGRSSFNSKFSLSKIR